MSTIQSILLAYALLAFAILTVAATIDAIALMGDRRAAETLVAEIKGRELDAGEVSSSLLKLAFPVQTFNDPRYRLLIEKHLLLLKPKTTGEKATVLGSDNGR